MARVQAGALQDVRITAAEASCVPVQAPTYVAALEGDGWIQSTSRDYHSTGQFVIFGALNALPLVPPQALVTASEVEIDYTYNEVKNVNVAPLRLGIVAIAPNQDVPSPEVFYTGLPPTFTTTTVSLPFYSPIAYDNLLDYIVIRGLSLYDGGGDEALTSLVSRLDVFLIITLPLPTIPFGPSFFSTTRNSTKLSCTLTAAAGISNSTYPLTVRTRYTQSDPSSRASQDDEIGQAQVFETDPQTVFGADAAARNIPILDSVTNLIPNTTYYAQLRCENADGDIVDSPWTSFTTRQFDTVLSF